MTATLWVTARGSICCLYEEILPLSEFGPLAIVRASQVEPDATGQWYADLGPVAGPRLGPFPVRSQALAAEQQWLLKYWLPGEGHG